MSLVKYRTRRQSPLFRDFSRLFNEDRTIMPVDLLENEDEYIIVANVPGVEKENIEIEVNHEFLELRVNLDKTEETTEENNEDNKKEDVKNITFLHRERYSSSFRRRFKFSKPVNSKSATTTLKDGVLTITLPKSEEAKSVKLSVN
ncbi:MAG: Hsp20/alpha crystallin family protein [Candidatus Heimdallarchaeota archaeon]|nr:Hsp20/alpha crystallin family protein [Candidatus Heimdallarchaeota archaeon]